MGLCRFAFTLISSLSCFCTFWHAIPVSFFFIFNVCNSCIYRFWSLSSQCLSLFLEPSDEQTVRKVLFSTPHGSSWELWYSDSRFEEGGEAEEQMKFIQGFIGKGQTLRWERGEAEQHLVFRESSPISAKSICSYVANWMQTVCKHQWDNNIQPAWDSHSDRIVGRHLGLVIFIVEVGLHKPWLLTSLV